MHYQLPTDPSITSNDPLGILDVEDAPQADILAKLIENAITQITLSITPPAAGVSALRTLLEDIAYTVHGNGSLDTSNLRDFLNKKHDSRDATLGLLQAAQELHTCFPTNYLRSLDQGHDEINLTGDRINSLLAHQFLGTLSQPRGTNWGLPDFTSWFASGPAHAQAVTGYLTTILDHFIQGGYRNEESFEFSLQTAKSMPDPSECKSVPVVHVHVVAEESEPSNTSGSPFVLVAAHSQPGPGTTATQEERVQSASPALSVSALVTPVIAGDAAIITSAFPVHTAWAGHNRTARLKKLFDVEHRPKRHYVLADALPIDEFGEEGNGLRDLYPGRVEREVKKLYAAFSGAIKMHKKSRTSEEGPCVIETGAWGCGAFGGNILVKTICMMVAAGLSGVQLEYALLEHRTHDIDLVRAVLDKGLSVARLWQAVTSSRTLTDICVQLEVNLEEV